MSSWLRLYQFKGCIACPFANADGSPCNREKFEVKAIFRAPQFFGDLQLFRRNEKVVGHGVVVGGVLYCMKAFSKIVTNHFSFVDLRALLPSSVHLVIDNLKPNARRKKIMLQQRGLNR
jgi:hypothetical protein